MRKSRGIGIALAGGVAVIAALVLGGPLLRPARTPNERGPAASLKTIASAQADYRGNDRDGNGKQDFWRADIAGLYAIVPSGAGEPIKLIEISVAAADDRPSSDAILKYATRGPKDGYWLRALRHAHEKDLDPNRFAACAFPADYPRAGRWTFVIDEGNTVYKRDLGRAGGIEVFPNEETLKKEWVDSR